ncbi:TPA: hypothetical protein EYP70_07810 [Candidatus Bathyarchaeota archaeon]|nr:hypothetical protein [Candidatus Bathyarchaeota archaeon]
MLDTYTNSNEAVLWNKRRDSKVIRLQDNYTPSFYIKPKDPSGTKRLESMISSHPNVVEVNREERYTPLNMERMEGLQVKVDSALNFRRVLRDVRTLSGVFSYYNVDLLHVQLYLFRRELPPMSMISIPYNLDEYVSSIRLVDDNLEVKPPPFTSLIFQVGGKSISKIEILNKDLMPIQTFKGGEREVLELFGEYLNWRDPDFPVLHEDETVKCLLERDRSVGIALNLGRADVPFVDCREPWKICDGRVQINLHSFLSLEPPEDTLARLPMETSISEDSNFAEEIRRTSLENFRGGFRDSI